MTDDLETELRTYRAHRFAITKINDSEWALFDPSSKLIGIGSIDSLAPLILTGPEHYELCVDSWIGRGRPTAATHDLLATLGLLPPPPVPIKRRI